MTLSKPLAWSWAGFLPAESLCHRRHIGILRLWRHSTAEHPASSPIPWCWNRVRSLIAGFLADKVSLYRSIWQAVHTLHSATGCGTLAFGATAGPRLGAGQRRCLREASRLLPTAQGQRACCREHESGTFQQLGAQFWRRCAGGLAGLVCHRDPTARSSWLSVLFGVSSSCCITCFDFCGARCGNSRNLAALVAQSL